MHPPPDTLHGDHVTLRRVTVADNPALYALAANAEVMRYMDWVQPTQPADTLSHLEAAERHWDDGSEYQWVILLPPEPVVIGTVSCRPRAGEVDIGYFLGRAWWGAGYATDAAAALVRWLQAQPHIERIWATADAENLRSRQLLERVGLAFETVRPSATVRPQIGTAARDTAVHAWQRAATHSPSHE